MRVRNFRFGLFLANSKVYSILVQENSVILGLNGGLLALTITSQEKIIELEGTFSMAVINVRKFQLFLHYF
jgi:hypothetical protein